jgi:hypothetical protein
MSVLYRDNGMQNDQFGRWFGLDKFLEWCHYDMDDDGLIVQFTVLNDGTRLVFTHTAVHGALLRVLETPLAPDITHVFAHVLGCTLQCFSAFFLRCVIFIHFHENMMRLWAFPAPRTQKKAKLSQEKSAPGPHLTFVHASQVFWSMDL